MQMISSLLVDISSLVVYAISRGNCNVYRPDFLYPSTIGSSLNRQIMASRTQL